MKVLCLSQIFGLFGFLFIMSTFGNPAKAESVIVCETAYGEKSFHIEDERVVFSRDNQDQGRSISSIEMVRTEKRHNGFDKILQMNGNKHRIHIENPGHFSEVSDYMVITSPKGHEMTYPLSCHKA